MSRSLQWVIGVCAVLVTLAIVFAVVAPWFGSWAWGGFSRGMMGGNGRGMMGGYGRGMMGDYGPGMMGGYGQGMMGGGSGMMPWGAGPSARPGAARLSMDQARTLAEEYAAEWDLTVSEVMEFENNFYAILVEPGTGRGAMEALIDPYTGAVGPEPGPNMMWNEKYGHMAFGLGGPNALTMEEAREKAQSALETQLPGSQVHEKGTSFYGYYTFDFDGPDGSIAGMLSVDAETGAAWIHTWHGGFLAEWEAEENES